MAWNDAQKETIEMVTISSVVPLIPNINVGENEKLSFHTVSSAAWCFSFDLENSAVGSGLDTTDFEAGGI